MANPCVASYQNLVLASGVVLSASSVQQSLPCSNLLDPLLTKTARTKGGWDVSSGYNDALDFTIAATQYNATIASGNYATGTAYATAVQSALTAAHANAWSVTYNPATGAFTISGSSSFVLLVATGTFHLTSGGIELGFTSDTSSGGGTTISGLAVYQSRHWFLVDFGAAVTATAFLIAGHNSGSTGTWAWSGNTANSGWQSPASGPITLSVGSVTKQGVRYNYQLLAPQTYRYFLISVNDTGNTSGFNELGVVYIGPTFQPTYTFSNAMKYDYVDLSSAEDAIGGAIFVDTRGTPRAWTLPWVDLPLSDRDALLSMAFAVPQGARFWFNFDATTPQDTTYCAMGQVHAGGQRANAVKNVQEKPGYYFDVTIAMTEVVES